MTKEVPNNNPFFEFTSSDGNKVSITEPWTSERRDILYNTDKEHGGILVRHKNEEGDNGTPINEINISSLIDQVRQEGKEGISNKYQVPLIHSDKTTTVIVEPITTYF